MSRSSRMAAAMWMMTMATVSISLATYNNDDYSFHNRGHVLSYGGHAGVRVKVKVIHDGGCHVMKTSYASNHPVY